MSEIKEINFVTIYRDSRFEQGIWKFNIRFKKDGDISSTLDGYDTRDRIIEKIRAFKQKKVIIVDLSTAYSQEKLTEYIGKYAGCLREERPYPLNPEISTGDYILSLMALGACIIHIEPDIMIYPHPQDKYILAIGN